MVEEHKVVQIDMSEIKVDSTNPNIMSENEIKALKKTMDKFGYLAPIILDKKLKIVDGEHRVKIYQKMGRKTIPAYVIDITKYDGKMLRQIMNKLRGKHDVMKDSLEYEILKNAKKLEEFSTLIGQPKQEFLDALQYSEQAQIPADEWKNMPEFVQEEEDIYKTIIVHFDSQKDVDGFAKQIDQNINEETRSIRIPFRPQRKTTKEWSDVSKTD